MSPLPYKRILVVGSTGAGKSTLAKQLAERFGYDLIELDALHWEPNWHEANPEVFRERVRRATQVERWIVAGNYHGVRDLIRPAAKAVIWIDYSFARTFWQLLRRTFLRWWKHEELWNGNHEPFWVHFKLWSDESLINWLLKTYWRRRREFPLLFARPENNHLKLIQLKHPVQTKQWLDSL